jgi:hypothetical protein
MMAHSFRTLCSNEYFESNTPLLSSCLQQFLVQGQERQQAMPVG